jgi:hypothetical protein
MARPEKDQSTKFEEGYSVVWSRPGSKDDFIITIIELPQRLLDGH